MRTFRQRRARLLAVTAGALLGATALTGCTDSGSRAPKQPERARVVAGALVAARKPRSRGRLASTTSRSVRTPDEAVARWSRPVALAPRTTTARR